MDKAPRGLNWLDFFFLRSINHWSSSILHTPTGLSKRRKIQGKKYYDRKYLEVEKMTKKNITLTCKIRINGFFLIIFKCVQHDCGKLQRFQYRLSKRFLSVAGSISEMPKSLFPQVDFTSVSWQLWFQDKPGLIVKYLYLNENTAISYWPNWFCSAASIFSYPCLGLETNKSHPLHLLHLKQTQEAKLNKTDSRNRLWWKFSNTVFFLIL